jgi:hypothetical protein
MIVGVKKVICTCGLEMLRKGGVFGGDVVTQDTYYCPNCQKHIIVLTPKEDDQKEFVDRLR